jgi:hypothetical protein
VLPPLSVHHGPTEDESVNNTVSARSFLFILVYAGRCRFALAILSAVGLLLAQQCCAGMSPSGKHGKFITVLSQPANIGDTKIAALALTRHNNASLRDGTPFCQFYQKCLSRCGRLFRSCPEIFPQKRGSVRRP